MSRTLSVDPCEVPELIAELTTVICLAPFLDQQDTQTSGAGRDLANAIRRIRRDLENFLTPDVLHDIETLLDHIEKNRGRYRDAILLWIDLLEEIAALMERELGDGTGPLKNRRVRAAVYHLMKGFIGDQPMPNVPAFLRPIVLEIAIRVTIEFLVALDHPERGPELWERLDTRSGEKGMILRTQVATARRVEDWKERFGAWLVRLFFRPPKLRGKLRVKVEAILARWEERNRQTNTTPAQRTVRPIIDSALWIGRHADQVRALVDLVGVAVREAAKLSNLSRSERIDVIKEAVVILIQEDLGFSGPVWGTIMRLMVDLLADAVEDLFQKRGVMAA
jgi:hypothetical protein